MFSKPTWTPDKNGKAHEYEMRAGWCLKRNILIQFECLFLESVPVDKIRILEFTARAMVAQLNRRQCFSFLFCVRHTGKVWDTNRVAFTQHIRTEASNIEDYTSNRTGKNDYECDHNSFFFGIVFTQHIRTKASHIESITYNKSESYRRVCVKSHGGK